MKASPIQKYALRLLMAAEAIQPPKPASWNNLSSESADSFLAPFGGSTQAIEKTELKTKETRHRALARTRSSNGMLVARSAKPNEKDTPYEL